MPRLWIALVVVLTAAACNRSSLKPGFCRTNADCKMNGWLCDQTGGTWECYNPDASMPDGDAGDGGDGRDGGDGGDSADRPPPFTCDSCADAGADGAATTCDFDASRCVECLENHHCVAKSATTPICQAQMCRPCRTDDECPAPNVCLTDGHCATGGEVIFVEFKSTGCPEADGSTDKPYCTPNEGAAQLASGKNVLIIRGPMADRLTLNTSGVAPVVVGKPAAGSAAASIPATAATAIQVQSDTVLVRDLAVTSGTAATSKGIVATSAADLTLLNVRVTVAAGLGVQVESGARLKMNRCTVENNASGGVYLGSLDFDITNSVIAKNGPGMDTGGVTWGGLRINATGAVPSTTRFLNNTVVQNNAVGLSCAIDVPVVGSIAYGNVTGESSGCTVTNCCTGDPLLSSNYRLTVGSPCLDKIDMAMSLFDDIDGQVRPKNLKSDCGADEF